MKVYILGAGPCGLAMAHRLSKSMKDHVVLIESQPTVGGLAQTVQWNGKGRHDLGPHKLFTLNKDVESEIRNLIPEGGWLTQQKVSRIFLKGHYLPYPPSPFSLVKVYGVFKFFMMGLNYATSLLKSMLLPSKATSFEDDLVSRLGRSMYNAMFKPIALKLWGDPQKLDSKLSKGRVVTPSLGQLLLKSVGMAKATETAEALTFFYPKGGLQVLWESMVKGLPKENLKLNHDVVGIQTRGASVTELTILNKNTQQQETLPIQKDDLVVSSIPLSKTLQFLFPHTNGNEPAISGHQDIIELNDLILVFIKIKQPKLMKDSWIFIPDSQVIFHRISEQASFDPSMTPNGSIVCCEIMSYPERLLINLPDSDLVHQTCEGLKKMGLIQDIDPAWETKVIRLPKSYPVYKKGSYEKTEKIMARLDQFKNFRSLGRQGSFNYIGSLDAVDIGYGAAEWVKNHYRTPAEEEKWAQERVRTSHFPVLD